MRQALEYVTRGWFVFPLHGKIPRTPRGYLDATNDPAVVEKHWTLCPDDWIGLALRPSGLIAVDVDVADGKNGIAELAELERLYGPLPRDCWQKSGRGGQHFVMRDPSPGPDGWTRVDGLLRGRLLTSIDIKCNGYIAVEPSGEYRWESLADVVPEVPKAWLDAIKKPTSAAISADGVKAWRTSKGGELDADEMATIREELATFVRKRGEGATFKAIKLIHHDYGRSISDGASMLLAWNESCGAPRGASELNRQIERVSRYSFEKERGWRVGLARMARILEDEARVPALRVVQGGLSESVSEASLSTGEVLPRAVDMSDRNRIRDQQGFEIDKKHFQRVNSPYNIEHALRLLRVDLRYNLLADYPEISVGGAEFRYLEEDFVNSVRFKIEKEFYFFPQKETIFDLVKDVARRNEHHPVRDYLDGLEWDGVARIDRWLSVYGGAEDTEFVRAISRIVLIAAVRRARSPGCKFDELLVLEGPQGTNKSTAIRVLAAHEDWFNDELPLSGDSKRVIESIKGRWLVEAGELAGLRQADLSTLKSLLSRQVDEARMAYGRDVRRYPRQCVFIGTTNDDKYLKDSTGNRRFWPVRVREFDVALLKLHRDQLWAEAAHYEYLGESIRLNPSLYAVAADVQEARVETDPITDTLETLLCDAVGILRQSDLLKLLLITDRQPTPPEYKAICKAMTKLGWVKKRAHIKGEKQQIYVKGPSGLVLEVERDSNTFHYKLK